MTRIQICGFRTAEAVITAIEAGVDAIGLVLVPSLSRTITVDEAGDLLREVRQACANRRMPEIVGLFADQPAPYVNDVISKLGLDAVQLCGDEGLGYCGEMIAPIYKVVGIDATVPRSVILPKIMILLQRHSLAGHGLVLDARSEGEYGGTGSKVDWDLASELSTSFKFSLAGGLTPDNVEEAVRKVKPFGVDTSSGVEMIDTVTGGRAKDPSKIRAFITAVRDVDEYRASRGILKWLSRGRK